MRPPISPRFTTPPPTHGASSTITEVPIQRPLCILITYADLVAPGTLQNALLAQPGVSLVDVFDATAATPSLALLKTYDMVTVFSNTPFGDRTAMGNNLADYVVTGGVVVELNFGFYRLNAIVASGSTQLAQWSVALPLLAYKGRSVGINADIGQLPPNWSGDFARLIINAGFSLHPNRNICSQIHLPGIALNY